MIKNDFIAKNTGIYIFFRWHPEVALRYLPIADEIKKYDTITDILEVGSGGLGIAPYLNKVVTGIDTSFKPPYHPKLIKIKGSVLKLPFEDQSYDCVISADLIEHLAPQIRSKAINEMMRVAKDLIIISVPCGKLSYIQDLELSNYYKKIFNTKYDFFQQHCKFGLPEKKEILDKIRYASKLYKRKLKIIIKGNENLAIQKFLMHGWITKNPIKNIIFRKFFLLLIPLFRFLDREPYYRQIFIIKIK